MNSFKLTGLHLPKKPLTSIVSKSLSSSAPLRTIIVASLVRLDIYIYICEKGNMQVVSLPLNVRVLGCRLQGEFILASKLNVCIKDREAIQQS